MNWNLIKSKPEGIRSAWIPISVYQHVFVCVLTVSVLRLLWVLLLLCVCLWANHSSGVSKRARHSRHWYWIGTSASTESTSVTSHSSENKAQSSTSKHHLQTKQSDMYRAHIKHCAHPGLPLSCAALDAAAVRLDS